MYHAISSVKYLSSLFFLSFLMASRQFIVQFPYMYTLFWKLYSDEEQGQSSLTTSPKVIFGTQYALSEYFIDKLMTKNLMCHSFEYVTASSSKSFPWLCSIMESQTLIHKLGFKITSSLFPMCLTGPSSFFTEGADFDIPNILNWLPVNLGFKSIQFSSIY